VWRISAAQLFNTVNGELVSCLGSNGNASETKANESFDNGVFFDIEAKRTRWLVGKFIS
jgi:hypothetical protein